MNSSHPLPRDLHAIEPPSACPSPGRIRRGVIGVFQRRGEFLMIQRAPQVALGGAWCFPGGHLEAGENARRAIVRELHEELGIYAEPVHRLGAVNGRPDVMLAIWIVTGPVDRIQPNPREISAARWMTGLEIRLHPQGLPSNLEVVDMLEAWMGRDACSIRRKRSALAERERRR